MLAHCLLFLQLVSDHRKGFGASVQKILVDFFEEISNFSEIEIIIIFDVDVILQSHSLYKHSKLFKGEVLLDYPLNLGFDVLLCVTVTLKLQ